MFGIAFGICLSSLFSLPQDPPQEQVLLTYPLRELTDFQQVPYAPTVWSVLGGGEEQWFGGDGGGSPLLEVPREVSRFALPEGIVDFLATAHAEDVDEERLSLELLGNSTLSVRGAPEAVQSAIETLRRTEGILARPILVEARLYDWDARELPPAVVSREELARLTDGVQPVWFGRFATRSAARVRLGQGRNTRYVRDADVEIAKSAAIGNPAMADMFEGVHLNVEPHSVIGTDELVVMCQFAISQQVRPMALRDTGIPGIPTLDVPFVEMDTGVMSGRISDGGALLYCAQTPDGNGSSLLLAVSASYDRERSPAPQGMRLLPVSAITSKSLQQLPVPRYGRATRSDDSERWLNQRVLSPGYGAVSPDSLQELVMTVHPDAWDDEAWLQFIGGFLVLHGNPALIDDVEQLLVQLQDRWLHTAQVEVVTTLDEARAGLGPLGEAITSEGPRPLHRIVFPALLGRSHVSSHGVETTELRNVNVEVAEGARIPEPVVDSVFGGTRTFVLPYAMDAGLGARVRLNLSHADEATRRSTGLEGGADLYPARTGAAFFTHHGPVESGQYLDFGVGPTVTVDNQTYRTRQRMRVSLR